MDEFRRETGRDFHLVTLPRFLQLFQATPDSVAEARSTIKSGAWENVVRALAALPPGGASAAAELVSIPYALRHMSWHRPKRSSVLDELSAALDDVVGEAAVIAATGQLPDTNALFRMVERAASSAGDVALPTGEAELVGSFVNDARKLHSLVAIIVNAAGLDDESKAAYRTSARQLSGQLIGYRQQMKLV